MREPRQIVGPRHAHPPNGDRACPRLAVTIIRRLQSFTQWWVRLNKPHTQKFGHFPLRTGLGSLPRHVADALAAEPATRADLWLARLGPLRPVMRFALVAVWVG